MMTLPGALQYRKMKPGEEIDVCDLVIRVFNEFIAPEFSQQGVESFLNYVKPDLLLNRSKANHFVLVAVAYDELVGMIEVRDHDHISLLFVDKQFLRRGVGKELLNKSLAICLKGNPNVTEISVNSSPYAVSIYEHLGFYQVGPKQVKDGIAFFPMVLELSDVQSNSKDWKGLNDYDD